MIILILYTRLYLNPTNSFLFSQFDNNERIRLALYDISITSGQTPRMKGPTVEVAKKLLEKNNKTN